MRPAHGRPARRPEAIAADIRTNTARFNAGEISETEWRLHQECLWREADFGEPLYCGVRSQAARRAERVMEALQS